MIRAILFDFNGVIIDDERIQMNAYMSVLKESGVDLTESEYFSCLGMDDKTFVRTAFERKGREASPELIEEIRAKKSLEWKRIIDGKIPLFQGIENLIVSSARSFPIGIVSMSKRADIEFVLEQSGLKRHFAHVTSAEDVVQHKPDPECYRLAFHAIDREVRRLGRSPLSQRECLVIEDSPPGVIAASTARLRTLGVTNTVSAEALRSAGAEVVASSLNGLTAESLRVVYKY